MRFNWTAKMLVFCLSATVCCAQYQVIPGNLDADGFPTTSARICLGTTGAEHCYTPPSDKYPFGMEPKAQTVAKLNGNDLILFTAVFSGGGSGWQTNIALVSAQGGEFVNLLPTVQLSNQSEYKLWSLPEFSSLPVLVTADFIWNFEAMRKSNYNEETHLSPHRYHVDAFVYDTKSCRYLEKAHYETTKKYPGLDNVDEIKVLDAEKAVILAKLRQNPHS